jgi:hypothetical protein
MLGSLSVGSLPNQGGLYTNAFSGAQGMHRDGTSTRLDLSMIAYDGQNPVDVLAGEDIVVGIAIALVLAFTASFLQGRRSQNDFVLWENLPPENVTDKNVTDTRVFDGEAWKEISRPDNYVFYNRKVNDRAKQKKDSGVSRVERVWVLVALLVLFVPIFSVEFFFALSRQLVCDGGNLISRPDWAEYLCSPVDVMGS